MHTKVAVSSVTASRKLGCRLNSTIAIAPANGSRIDNRSRCWSLMVCSDPEQPHGSISYTNGKFGIDSKIDIGQNE